MGLSARSSLEANPPLSDGRREESAAYVLDKRTETSRGLRGGNGRIARRDRG
jgi:hypothetical protein